MIKNSAQNWNKYKAGFYQKISLLMFFIISFNADLNNSRIIWWGTFGFLLIIFLLYIHTKNFTIKKIKMKYIVWNISFICFSVLSTTWAISAGYSIEVIKKMLIRSTVLWFISILCNEKNDFFKILNLFIIASVVNSIYILWKIDLATLGNIRIGAGSLGEDWNANAIGMTMAFAAFMSYFLYKTEQNTKKKLLYFISILFFGIIVLFTGSRKALFIFGFAPLLFYYISSENKMRTTFLILLGGACLLYFVMNAPTLYNIIGKRIKSFWFYFSGNGNADSSTITRMEMINHGFIWFKEKPILGYGINNYSKLYGATTDRYTYAHNNLIELLVGMGFLGVIIYYYIYIYIIKNTFGKKNLFSAFAFTSIITILIVEIGLVSYITFYIQLLICLSFSAISIAEQEELNSE